MLLLSSRVTFRCLPLSLHTCTSDLVTPRTMLTKTELLKLRAIDVLTEKIERRITPVGDLLPTANVTTFEGETVPISNFYKNKPLLLVFLRASW